MIARKGIQKGRENSCSSHIMPGRSVVNVTPAPNVKKSRVVSLDEIDARHVGRENESAKKRDESLEITSEHIGRNGDTDSEEDYILNFAIPSTNPWVKVERRKKSDARPASAREEWKRRREEMRVPGVSMQKI